MAVDDERRAVLDHVEVAHIPEVTERPAPPANPGTVGENSPAPPAMPTGAPSPQYIYAIGQVEPRFPSLEAEKEFAQATGRADTVGLTDRQALQSVLADRANRYLARQLCWTFTIEGLETYILAPADPADLELLVDAVRPGPRPTDVDVVLGVRGPLAPPEACNGLVVPVVIFQQLWSFDRDELIDAIPRPDDLSDEEEQQFGATASEVFDRIMQMADNAGATDEHRALNYIATRYHAVYARTAEAHRAEASLTAIEVRPSRLSGTRKILDVILSYRDRGTDVTEKYFVRVDVTGLFPFLVTKLTPYYERT